MSFVLRKNMVLTSKDGIPGFYERQEALMANMFGFPYFKETGGSSRQKQRFGYWYRFIEKPKLESM